MRSFPIALHFQRHRRRISVLKAILFVGLAVAFSSIELRVLMASFAALYGYLCVARTVSVQTSVVLTNTGIRLPALFVGFRAVELPYEEIRSIGLQRGRRTHQLFIKTGSRGYTIPDVALSESGGVAALLKAVLELRQDTERGKRWLARRELDKLHLKAFRHLPNYTVRVLGCLILLGYGAEIKLGAVEPLALFGGDPVTLIRLGAYTTAFSGGEHWYRLIATMFLHAGLLHLYVNGIAFWALGSVIERLLGAARFVLVFLISGVMGSLVSGMLRDAAPAVGASGAIFGLLGAFLVLHFYKHSPLPQALRQTRRWWLVILVLNIGLPILIPQVDATAHGVGFLSGAFATVLLLGRGGRIGVAGFPTRLAGMVMMGGALAMLVSAFTQAKSENRYRIEDALLTYAENTERENTGVDDKVVPSAIINRIAWHRVQTSGMTDVQLEKALRGARGALKRTPDNFALRDTVASLLFRLGQREAAREQEARVFADATAFTERLSETTQLFEDADSRRVFATQMYRFSRQDMGAFTDVMRFDSAGRIQLEPWMPMRGRIRFMAVSQGDEVKGVLWLAVAADADQDELQNVMDYRPPPGKLALLFERDWAASQSQYGYWPLDPEIMALPER